MICVQSLWYVQIMLDKEVSIMKTFMGDQVTWFRPITLQEVLALKETHPNASMVVGNTEVGKSLCLHRVW